MAEHCPQTSVFETGQPIRESVSKQVEIRTYTHLTRGERRYTTLKMTHTEYASVLSDYRLNWSQHFVWLREKNNGVKCYAAGTVL